ncbi:MAG: P-loop NTPase [Halobacteriovoraceae bacterium]|nr:P-loop NTPase [Halobacteriovoraceae bacterium]
MNQSEIENIINSLQNPTTKKTFSEENRLVKVSLSNRGVDIVYNREGIDTRAKREIEDQIIEALIQEYTEDQIFVKTVSEEKTKTQQEASLKIGHGPMPEKKKIPGVKKVIAVSSCKGGVGKSTFAVNLAISLKAQGHSVGLLDADIYGPSLPILLNQRNAKPKAADNKKIIPIETNGIKFISFGLFVKEEDAVIWRGPMLGGVLNQFFFEVNWGSLDYMIIDLPPGTGDVQLSLVQSIDVDGSIIVSTPQEVALLDTVKGLKMFEKVNVPVLGMVENMSSFVCAHGEEYYIFGKNGVKEIADGLKVEFLGKIPISIELRESCDKGQPYMDNDSNRGTQIWESYMEIAKEISRPTKKGILDKIFRK